VPAQVVSASFTGLRRRSLRDKLLLHLNKKAEFMVGLEAVMELVEELKEVAPLYLLTNEQQSVVEREAAIKRQEDSQDYNEKPDDMLLLGRRWIWVHHITNSDRRKSIVREARELQLCGYLCSGYPGIIVVEGVASACDEFVTWVKGNKSRPGGGFGRNWGHHVRGHVNFSSSPEESKCLLSAVQQQFEELEDLAVLGGLCKLHGLETEFLEYVMQHKGAKSS
jgi:hypothetical protein